MTPPPFSPGTTPPRGRDTRQRQDRTRTGNLRTYLVPWKSRATTIDNPSLSGLGDLGANSSIDRFSRVFSLFLREDFGKLDSTTNNRGCSFLELSCISLAR